MHALDNYLARQDGKTSSEKKPNKRGDMVYPDGTERPTMASLGFKVSGSGVHEAVRDVYREKRSACRECHVADNNLVFGHVTMGFKDSRTVAEIHATREINGKIEEQTRYFISSLPCDARQMAHAVRAHWSIENPLHWRLDVVFKEDEFRIRKDHAPENLATMRRVALGLIKDRLPPPNMTVKRARLRAALNRDFALKHFFANN